MTEGAALHKGRPRAVRSEEDKQDWREGGPRQEQQQRSPLLRDIMMMKHVTVLAALMGSLSVAAQAEETQGFYFGAGIGQLTQEVDDTDLKGDDTAFKLLGGYQFNKHFGAELAYIDGGEATDSEFGVNFSQETKAVQAAVLGMAPINEAFSVYAKLGLLAWDAEASATDGFTTITAEDDGNDPVYGIGGAFKFGAASFKLEYEIANIDDTDVNLISLNFTWTPGKR